MPRYTVPFYTGTRTVMVTYDSDGPIVGEEWTPPRPEPPTRGQWATIGIGAGLALLAIWVLHLPQRPRYSR